MNRKEQIPNQEGFSLSIQGCSASRKQCTVHVPKEENTATDKVKASNKSEYLLMIKALRKLEMEKNIVNLTKNNFKKNLPEYLFNGKTSKQTNKNPKN